MPNAFDFSFCIRPEWGIVLVRTCFSFVKLVYLFWGVLILVFGLFLGTEMIWKHGSRHEELHG
jgi:hypothetical protein